MDEDEVCQQPSPEEDHGIDARSRQGSRTPEQPPPYVQRSSSSHASRVSPHNPVKVEPYDGPSDCPNSDLEGHSGEEEEENDDEGSSCSPLAGRTDEPSDESDPLNCVRHSMDASGLSQDTFLNGGSAHSVDSNPDTLGTLMAESASEEGVLNSDRHSGPVYQCHICGYTGTSKFHFNSHMNTHYDHKCSQCDYTSRTEGRLKRHLRDFHSESAGDGYDRHDSGANGTRTVRVSTQGKVKTYKCKQCSFVATAKTDFWEHSKTHIKAEKLLTCPKCPFVTEYKHHLEYHLRNHFGSKPFKCPKCNYSCVNKSMLNSHMKSHSNIYQYRCSDCAYATKYCHSLKLHLRKYGHKPSTVLNVDGTPSPVPVIDVYGSRRGPRSRKHHDELMSGFNPFTPLQIPMNGGLPSSAGNTPVPQFLYPGTVVNGFHGSIALHHPAGGGIGKVYPRNTKDQVDEYAENGRYQAVVAHTHLSQASPPERLRCNLCDFSTDSREAFTKHMLLHAAAENQDLCNLYGISSESLVQEPPGSGAASASHHPPQISMHSTHQLLHHSPRPTLSVPGTMPRSQPHSPHCPPPPPIQLSPHHLQPSIPHSQSCHPTVSLAAELMITPTSAVVQTSGGLTPYHQRPSPTEGPGGAPSFRKPAALQSETGNSMDQNFRAPIPGGTKFSSPPSTHPLEHLRLFSENIAVRSMFVKELLPHSFPTFPSTLPAVVVPGTGNGGNNCISAADAPYGPNSSLLQQQPTVSSAATLTIPSHPCKPMAPQDVPRLQLKPTTGAVGHVPLDLSNTKFPRLGLPLQRRPNSNVQVQELPSVSGSSSVEATVVMSPSVSPPLAMSPVSVSRSAPAISPPHKHRRKGKAFKLDRICMKLQEKVTPRDSPDGTECPPSETLHGAGDVAYDDVMEKDQDSTDSTKMDEVIREASTNTGFVMDLDGAEFTHRDSNGVKRHNRSQVLKSYEFHEEKVGSKDGSEKINGRSPAAPPPKNAKVEAKVFPAEQDEELRDDEDSHWKEAYECQYCDMAFKDCIMYTVHMGYHGFKDPFKCNMCGQQTKDKVAFFLHIARTAHL